MTVIRKEDVISSVADALQYISYYHPLDFVQALEKAYHREQSQAAKDAIAQILINSRMSAEGHRPICQDTGIVTCFVKIGMNVHWDSDLTVQEMIDEGVRQAYTNPLNPLRASVVADPAGSRKNTRDNAPAVVHIDMVAGDKVDIQIAAKGGGSENKTKMVMLNPSDDIADWVEKTVPLMGAGWCPPGMIGIGVGGTAEKAAVLAKESLMEAIDIHELKERGAQNAEEELRLDIYERVNRLGIGAQGLGGLT
ncbi:fumarate hydratase, partial [Photobacterium damselae subsp. damselae]|nr:fumarate hydratase [Photobacterium damselae subsp. damselae]